MPRKPRGLFQWMWRATTGKVNGKALPWSRTRIWFLWTMGLSVFFVGVSALNLDDFPIVTSDEGWVISTPYKLTTQGIFGSYLYAGFFNA